MAEVKEERFAGPFEKPPFEYYIQSPLGLVPKGKDKVRLIFHLSFDFEDKSVNHYIPEEKCTVKYHDLDEAVKFSLNLGRKPVVYGKTDMTSAYCLVPLKPSCRPWLVMKAKDPRDNKFKYFIEKCLPFGSSISCAIFQKFLNAIKYVFVTQSRQSGLIIWVVNYLDDFLFIHWRKLMCDEAIREFLELCSWLGIKIAMEKTEWGTTKIVFLGILLDGDNLILAIPEEKRLRAINMIKFLISKRKATCKELQRLAGYLNFLT